MDWINTIMPYAIYLVLGMCVACLGACVVVFFILERRWQVRVELDAESVMQRGRYKEPVREDTVSPLQWQQWRHRLEEMQIVAEETVHPLPYEKAA